MDAPLITHLPSARITAIHTLHGVRAGSALVRAADRLLAVQDDAWSVALVSLPQMTVELRALRGDGRAASKAEKPDFEAAISTADGAIHLFASGSTAQRCAWARIAPDFASVSVRQMSELYSSIQRTLGLAARPNIEAAVLLPDGILRLFHRGAGLQRSASVDFSQAVLDGESPRVLNTAWLRFGSLDGVTLHITDAVRMDAGRVGFLAAAEDVADAISDGPVHGSVIGILEIESPGEMTRWARICDPDGVPSRLKAEGLLLDEDCGSAWVLIDPDSADHPAQLCRVVLEGLA